MRTPALPTPICRLPQRSLFRTTLTAREGVVIKHRSDLGGIAVELESNGEWIPRVVRPDLAVFCEEV